LRIFILYVYSVFALSSKGSRSLLTAHDMEGVRFRMSFERGVVGMVCRCRSKTTTHHDKLEVVVDYIYADAPQ